MISLIQLIIKKTKIKINCRVKKRKINQHEFMCIIIIMLMLTNILHHQHPYHIEIIKAQINEISDQVTFFESL